MPVSQLPQAPFRQDRRVFPTPLIGDVLFSEVRDCNRALIPEYGTLHPDAVKWPDHKLVYVKPVDIERDGVFEFFYAADRENQDLYNFSSGYRNIVGNVGGREFRVVQRTYVTLREHFQPLDISFGTPMPNIPESKFDGVEYVFFDRQQQAIQEETLNSLYVAEVHTYIETAFLELKISFSATKSDVVPEKFRVSIPQTSTEQIVEGLAEQPYLTGSQLSVKETQINPDIKVVDIVSREKPVSNISLDGGRAYVEGGPPANVIETYSRGPLDVDTGVFVVQSTVTPLGDGSSVRETVEVESWPVLTGSEFDPVLNTQVINTQQMVEPPTDFSEPNTSFRPINEDRSLKIVEEIPVDALEAYHISVPTRIDLRMPAVLKAIRVLWVVDESASGGESVGSATEPDEANDGYSAKGYSITASAGMEGRAEYSARPTVSIDTETVFGNDISATVHFFYLDSRGLPVNENSLLSRISDLTETQVISWPRFKPKSHTIIANGATVTSSATAKLSSTVLKTFEDDEISSESSTETGSYAIDRSIEVINVAPTIHGPITVFNGNDYSSIFAATTAVARLDGNVFGDEVRVNPASAANSASAPVGVIPLSLPATNPSDIPRSGSYLVGSSAEPFKWGWLKCSATIIDASQFDS